MPWRKKTTYQNNQKHLSLGRTTMEAESYVLVVDLYKADNLQKVSSD